MKRIEAFEDMEVWQQAREMVKAIYSMTNQNHFAQDFGLCNQIQRASVSVMSNIAEGFERGSDRDFARFLFIAKASAAEVRSQLYVAFDLNYIDAETLHALRERLISISKQISGFIKYLSTRR